MRIIRRPVVGYACVLSHAVLVGAWSPFGIEDPVVGLVAPVPLSLAAGYLLSPSVAAAAAGSGSLVLGLWSASGNSAGSDAGPLGPVFVGLAFLVVCGMALCVGRLAQRARRRASY